MSTAPTLEDMVERVATQVKRAFPQVDRNDIRQEVWIWALENADKVEAWLEEGGKRAHGSLYTALRRAGTAYATREKAAIVGYDPDDLHYYSLAQLRELLPLCMDREAWYLTGVDDENRTKSTVDPALGNTRLAMICDVRASLEAGSPGDKHLLWTVFGLAKDEATYAEELGITEDALLHRVTRALQRVQKRLGGPNPLTEYDGNRRAISNAQAQAITHNQEDPGE